MGDALTALRDRARKFGVEIKAMKAALAPPGAWAPGEERGFWYPYETIGNVGQIERTLTGPNRELLETISPRRSADFGAADGDLAFFLEREGWEMTIIENPPTNFNGLRGARLLKETLRSSVAIREVDLDSQFT